jgi:predicted nucleic acid-binding protein
LKLIDANVLMYTVGGEHPYKRPSIAVLAKQQLGEIEANINAEVLQEILHFYHRRKRTVEGFRLFDDVVVKFPSPFPILASTVRMARQVLGNNPRLQSRDALHAAVVFEHRLEGIISADRTFDGIAGLRRFDPKELAA